MCAYRAMELTDTSVFCYGTLMIPEILVRVIGRKGEDLTFQDALIKASVA